MSKLVYSFTEPAVGTDAEFFLKNASDEPVSSVGIIGGEKDDPILCEGGGYLEDCVAVEINPVPATLSEGATVFADNIVKCMDAVEAIITPLDLSIDIAPARLFEADDLGSPQARESGCSKSYCAWRRVKVPRIDITDTHHRFASGDLHLSWKQSKKRTERINERINVARYVDILMMCGQTIAEPEHTERDNYYGISGRHRPTPYGVEVKSPSNFWLRSREEMEWAFGVCSQALKAVTSHDQYKKDALFAEYEQTIQRIRENGDVGYAEELLSNFGCPAYPA